jgi:hypothetical protein
MTRQEALLAVAYLAMTEADRIRFVDLYEPENFEHRVELLDECNRLDLVGRQAGDDAGIPEGDDTQWQRVVAWIEGGTL